jgi:hypothetical protein
MCVYIRVWQEEFSVCKISKGSTMDHIRIGRPVNSSFIDSTVTAPFFWQTPSTLQMLCHVYTMMMLFLAHHCAIYQYSSTIIVSSHNRLVFPDDQLECNTSQGRMPPGQEKQNSRTCFCFFAMRGNKTRNSNRMAAESYSKEEV